MGARLVFRDAAGRELTTDDLKGVSGKVRWEVIGAGAVPAEASRLHTEAREAGGRGDYPRALNLLEQAHRLAPDWPYPVYDTAFTYLLQGDCDEGRGVLRGGRSHSAARLFHCQDVTRLPPARARRRSVSGFCKAFASLEWMDDKAKKTALLEGIVEKVPDVSSGMEGIEQSARRRRCTPPGHHARLGA